MNYVPPPGPPLNLTASASTTPQASQVILNWTAATPQAGTSISRYIVYRQDSGNWPPLVSLSGTTFTDTNVSVLQTYSYYAVAIDSRGAVSAPSNLVSATVPSLSPPAAVASLTALSISSTQINLNWPAASGATSYVVKRNNAVVGSPTGTTFSDTGLTPSTTYSYSVAGQNSAGTGTAATASAATLAASGSPVIKFNPSAAYWQMDYNTSYSTQSARFATLKSKCPQTKGFEIFIPWAHLENPAIVGGAAQYDGSWVGTQSSIDNKRGFDLIDAFIAAAAAQGCQLMVMIHGIGGHSNGGDVSASSFPSNFMPTYLGGSAYGPKTPTTNGVWGGVWMNSYTGNGVQFTMYIRWWVQAVADRINLLGAAYGARYDTNPNLETVGFTADEMVVSANTTCTDAGQLATVTGANGIMASWRASFPHTQCRLWTNYFQTTATMDTFLAEIQNRKWSMGGPDTCNDAPVVSSDPTLNSDGQYRSITAAYRWLGWTKAGGDGGVRDPNSPDYSGVAHAICEVEAEDTSYDAVSGTTIGNSRHLGDGILPHIVNQANRLGATHMVWFDNTFSGRAQVQTNTAHPNLCDFISSVAQGGNVNVNGITAGIALTNKTRPPSWG